MMKIELVKFEAQDVITASGVAAPAKPACICNDSDVHHSNSKTGLHEIQLADGSWKKCEAEDHVR